MQQHPHAPDQTARIAPEGLSDDTRPVPRDRGPVGPEGSGPAAPAPEAPAASPGGATAEAPAAGSGTAAAAVEPPAPAPGAEDTGPGQVDTPDADGAGAAPGEPDEADRTQDIRFPPDSSAERPVPPAPADAPVAGDAARTDTARTDAAVGAGDPAETAALPPDRSVPPPAPAGTGPATGAWADDPAATVSFPADRSAPAPHAPSSGDGGATAGAAGGGRPWWRRPAVLTPVAAAAVLAGAYGVDLAVAGDDVPRNTVVAGIEIGGLSPARAAETLETELAPRVEADHVVVADDVQAALSPATAGITLDVEGTVEAAGDQPLNPWTRLVSVFTEREVDPVITGEETALAAQIDTLAEQVDRAPVDATILIEDLEPQVVEPQEGRRLDREGAAEAVTRSLADGGDPATPIELPVEFTPVRVDAAEAERVLAETVTPALAAPVTVASEDGGTSVEVPESAIASSLTFTPQEDGQLAVAVDPAALQEAMGEDLTEFGTPAEDARFVISGDRVSVVPSVDGTGIDPTVLAGQLLEVLPQPAPRTVTAQLGAVPADFTTAEAEALGIRERISTFTTNFTNQASGTNIRVAAQEVDGAIVRPGETFSLNDHTGPRGVAQGYVEAGVINNGEFTTAVGGGVSQFATTMFNAVFFAGLEDVYHKPHSYYISRYPPGREATVYYDSIDLQWRNDGETGVYVQTQWTPGSITVSFWGTKRYEIESLSSDRYNIREPVVQDKPAGPDCTPSNGTTGFDITVTRVFRDVDTGAEIRREEFRTRYAAQPIIRCVPAPESAVPPAPENSAPSPAPGG